jgi:hypothetical protein
MATRKWSELKEKMAPERRARVDAAVRRELVAMDVRELPEKASRPRRKSPISPR